MSGPATRRVFCFGPFEAHQATSELRKHGIRIKLPAQPFQVLLLLLERPGELVTRQEMRNRLWGDGTFVDFEHGLNAAVNKIRDALSDSAAQPRYIETIAGKGYRFIAPVQPAPLPASPTPSILTAPSELPATSRHVTRYLLLGLESMYLVFYFSSLANLQEIHEILLQNDLFSPLIPFATLIATACLLIPVRLYLAAAIAFDVAQLPAKFRSLFPFLLPCDLLWSLSPLLLIHHINLGLALGLCAALVYAPFAQRSLILMHARAHR